MERRENLSCSPGITEELLGIARRCRHYAMCKIDYLGTGVCASGSSNHYVSYYPQGRMDLYAALYSQSIPVTATLKDVIETCNLCGVCDMQCHFYTGMRPSVVMKGLKDYLAKYIECGEIIHDVETNATLEAIRTILSGNFGPPMTRPYE